MYCPGFEIVTYVRRVVVSKIVHVPDVLLRVSMLNIVPWMLPARFQRRLVTPSPFALATRSVGVAGAVSKPGVAYGGSISWASRASVTVTFARKTLAHLETMAWLVDFWVSFSSTAALAAALAMDGPIQRMDGADGRMDGSIQGPVGADEEMFCPNQKGNLLVRVFWRGQTTLLPKGGSPIEYKNMYIVSGNSLYDGGRQGF